MMQADDGSAAAAAPIDHALRSGSTKTIPASRRVSDNVVNVADDVQQAAAAVPELSASQRLRANSINSICTSCTTESARQHVRHLLQPSIFD